MSTFSFELPGWAIRLLRRTLYLWTHPNVFPETPDKLGLDPALPVLYVLQYRHLSNLLVLDQECRNLGLPRVMRSVQAGGFRTRKAAFFLSADIASVSDEEPEGEDESNSLLNLLAQEALRNPEFNVQLVPVTILWGRAPDRKSSVLKALFSEAWQSMGAFSQFVATVVNGRDTLVRFSEPANLRELLRNETQPGRAAHKVARVMRIHFRRQREIAIGPNLSHRQTQMHVLLGKPDVRAAIAADAIKRSVPFVEAERTARGYAMEVASDFSYSVVQALVIVLDWVWTRIYDGLNIHHFDRVTEVAKTHTLVYVPCHRSHIDYLLISFLLHQRAMSLPHIAAGANLNLPVVGPILRRGGAFFLRRKIKGNDLYATIFSEYLSLMISQGFPIEYFVEGGRSRSGRTLPPKAGMVSMTMQSFIKNRSRPLAFVPIYIGYEKLMEGNTYLAELGGKPKKGESLLGVIASVRELRKYFGKVHINFGKPLLLSNYLDAQHATWASEEPDFKSEWFRKAVDATSNEIARRINAAATVTPISLIALSLLSTPKHTADTRQLQTQIEHLQYLLSAVPYDDSTVLCADSTADAIAHAIRLDLISCKAHPLGDMVMASSDQSSLLAYFRNNVLHLVALPALLACLVSHNRLLSRERAREAIAGIYSLLRAELFLHWEPDQLDAVLDQMEEALAARGLIVIDTELGLLRSPQPMFETNAELRQLGEIIRPTLERQFLTLALLQHHGSGKLTRETLEQSGHLLAQRLSLLYEFNSPEFSEKSLFANVIRNLISAELLRQDEAGYLHFDQRITAPAAHTELLLSPAVRHSIERIARSERSESKVDIPSILLATPTASATTAPIPESAAQDDKAAQPSPDKSPRPLVSAAAPAAFILAGEAMSPSVSALEDEHLAIVDVANSALTRNSDESTTTAP
jgi:glycerol-3-phosphate O-acyltransferase